MDMKLLFFNVLYDIYIYMYALRLYQVIRDKKNIPIEHFIINK